MSQNTRISVLIEGHTDIMPVKKLIHSCGYFETNFQLSTLRAINVRNAILSHIKDSIQYSRIGASGYGETRPRNKANPYANENRRIEIRLIMLGALHEYSQQHPETICEFSEGVKMKSSKGQRK